MGLFFGGGSGKIKSSISTGFNKNKQTGSIRFKGDLEKAGISYDKRRKIERVTDAQFRNGRHVSYNKILNNIGNELGSTVKQQVIKAIAPKDDSARREAMKQKFLRTRLKMGAESQFDSKNLDNNKIINAALGGAHATKEDLKGVNSGKSSSVSMGSLNKTGGFAGGK